MRAADDGDDLRPPPPPRARCNDVDANRRAGAPGGRHLCAPAVTRSWWSTAGCTSRPGPLPCRTAIAAREGRTAEARRCHEENLVLKRELNDQTGIVSSLSNLGIVALHEHRGAEAYGLQQEALRLRLRLGLRHGIRESLVNLAALARAEKDYARALRLWGAADRLAESLGVPVSPVEEAEAAEAHAEVRSALGDAICERGLAEGHALIYLDTADFGVSIGLFPNREEPT